MCQHIPIINMNGQTCYSNNKIDSPVIYFRGNNDYINNNCTFIKQSGITMDMDDCKVEEEVPNLEPIVLLVEKLL